MVFFAQKGYFEERKTKKNTLQKGEIVKCTKKGNSKISY
jgi:hypothetical protein